MRRTLRIAAWSLLGLIVVIAALGVGAIAYLRTEPGRAMLAQVLSDVGRAADGSGVTIGGVGEGLPFRLAVTDVAVADAAGTWLTVDSAVVTWRPAALFAGRLHVTDASVAGVRMLRQPEAGPDTEPPEPEDDAGIEIPSLPVGLRVDSLRVDPVAIDAAVAGEAATLRLEGRLAADVGDAIVTDLRLLRLDGAGGEIVVDATLDPAAETLRMAVRIAEPEGGMILRLAGLSPYPPLSVTITGDGPLDDWSGTVAAAANGLFDVTADVGVVSLSVLRVSGTADVAGLLDAPLLSVVGEAVRFDMQAAVGSDVITVERLLVRAAAVELTAAGRIEGETIAAEATLAVTDPARLDGLIAPAAFAGGRVHLEAGGTVAAPRLTLRGRLDALQAPGISVDGVDLLLTALPTSAAVERIDIDLRMDAAGVLVDDPTAAPLVGDTAALAFSGSIDVPGDVSVLDQVSVDLAFARLLGRARYGFGDGALEAAMDLTVDDLAALAPLAGMPLGGTALVSLGVTGNMETSALQGSVAAALADAVTGDALLDALLGPAVDLSAGFTLAGDETLTINDIDFEAALLSLQGQARLHDGLTQVTADLAAQVAALTPLSDALGTPLAGRLAVTATAAGPVADPTVRVALRAPEVAVGETRLSEITAELSAATVVSAATGDLSAAAITPYGPASLATAFAVTDGDRLRLSRIAARAAGLGIDGDLVVPFDGTPMEGTLSGRLGPEGIAIDGQRLSGRANLDVQLGGDARVGQTVTVELTGDELRLAEGGAETLAVRRLSARGGITDALGTPGLRLDARGEGIVVGGVTVDTLTADVGGNLESARFALTAAGPGEPAFQMDAAGTFGVRDGTTRIDLATLDARAGDHRLALQQPVTVTLADGRTQVETLTLTLDGGTLTATADLGGAEPVARVTARGLPLGLADLAAPDLNLGGTLDADIDLRRDGRQLGGTISVRLTDVVQDREAIAAMPTLNARVDGTWSGGIVDLRATVGGFGDDLQASARIPVSVDAATLATTLDERAPITGQVRWQGEMEPLIEALPLAEHRVTGPGRIALDVGGTLGRPTLSGEVALENGSYEHLTFGTLLRPLTLRAAATGGEALDVTLDGRDGGDGTLTARGRVDLDGGDLTLEASFRQAVLVRRDDVTAQATGDINANLGPDGGRIAGRVETDRVNIQLLDTLPPSVVNLDVIEIRTEADAIAAAERRDTVPPPASAIALDLELNMPRRVFVRGRGLESEWSGNLRVTGTTDQPIIVGSIDVVRGSFSFADKPFRLTRGRVEFLGGRTIDPRIDIETTYVGRDATAVLGVSGPVSDLEIRISSPDGLPESEVLPRALFSKNASQLSPGEALELALAIDALRGGGSISDSIVGSFRDALGVDTLSFDAGLFGDEGPSVRIGRYVTPDIFIETRQGTTPGTSTYRAEYRITPSISAEMELGDPSSDTGGSIGLKWQMDY